MIDILQFLVLFCFLSDLHCYAMQMRVIEMKMPSSSHVALDLPDHKLRDPQAVIISGLRPPLDWDGRILNVADQNGAQYRCYLPPRISEQSQRHYSNTMSNYGNKASLLSETTPEELLDSLGDWCAYRIEDWWTYEVCYKKGVRQYHSEDGKVTMQYLLGNYSASESDLNSPKTDDAAGSKGLFVQQTYTHGDPCEIGGNRESESRRTAEVRFKCGKGGQQMLLVEVAEPQTCRYRLTVHSPQICRHPAFQEAEPLVAHVQCYPHLHDNFEEVPPLITGIGDTNAAFLGKDENVDGFVQATLMMEGNEDDAVLNNSGEQDNSDGLGTLKKATKQQGNTTTGGRADDDYTPSEGADGVGLNDLFHANDEDEYYGDDND